MTCTRRRCAQNILVETANYPRRKLPVHEIHLRSTRRRRLRRTRFIFSSISTRVKRVASRRRRNERKRFSLIVLFKTGIARHAAPSPVSGSLIFSHLSTRRRDSHPLARGWIPVDADSFMFDVVVLGLSPLPNLLICSAGHHLETCASFHYRDERFCLCNCRKT